MMQESSSRNRKSGADLQRFADRDDLAECLAVDLMSYINKTDVPILAEYCAENKVYEDFILKHAKESLELQTAVAILETKKRGTLERMIYTSEINATIGGQLIKSWRETVLTEPPPKYRSATVEELDALELTDEEIQLYSRIQRNLPPR
jgi:hypothetical protein